MIRYATCFTALLLCLVSSLGAQPLKMEPYLLLPEPKAMRSVASCDVAGAQHTVLSPAHQVAGQLGVETYSSEAFTRLGISKETFTERAEAAADKRLAALQPEFIKDDSGKTRYAVYRSVSPLMATLMIAPSLGKTFAPFFGDEVWVAAPDRNSLFVFPAKPESLAEFAADLKDRYEGNPFAASCEVFAIKKGEKALRVVATFGD